jgi:hypothetical protein
MRKLIDERTYYRVNGGEWRDCSIWKNIRYWEEENCQEWNSRELSFSSMWELVELGFVPGAKIEHTIFNRRKLILPSGFERLIDYTYRENSRIKFEVKKEYEPYNSTIKNLADLLPADGFCEYLKDRGIAQVSAFL